MARKLITCCICGRKKDVDAKQETCGMQCRTKLLRQRYGKGFFAWAAKHASRAAASKHGENLRAKWEEKYPGVPYEVGQRIRTDGYRAGYNTCHMSHRRHFEKMRAKEFEAGYQQGLMEARMERRMVGVA